MLLYLVAFGIGVLLAVHLTMNSAVGTMMGSARKDLTPVNLAGIAIIWLPDRRP